MHKAAADWTAEALTFESLGGFQLYDVPAELCDYEEKRVTQTTGEAFVMTHTTRDQLQFSGSIQAEKTPDQGPMLCSDEVPCTLGECSDEGLCLDNNNDIIPATLYKVTWGVTSPQDDKHSEYIDESGFPAVKFNIKLVDSDGKETLYYKDPETQRATLSTIEVANGARAGKTILEYSTKNYEKVCVVFGQRPKDLFGKTVPDFCATFKKSKASEVEWDQAGRNAPKKTDIDGLETSRI